MKIEDQVIAVTEASGGIGEARRGCLPLRVLGSCSPPGGRRQAAGGRRQDRLAGRHRRRDPNQRRTRRLSRR
jgi:hypothetical protein